MPGRSEIVWPFAAALAGVVLAPGVAHAQPADDGFPTTEFQEGEATASVSAGGVTATVVLNEPPGTPMFEAEPILRVSIGDDMVVETTGYASGFDFPAAAASIADIDPGNRLPEVYFSSYSGGAHCCSLVMVATATDDGWNALEVGEFDGDGNYLEDADGDGLAEIVTVDNSFLYRFDCYACSAAPLVIYTVRDGKVVDVSGEPRYREAHRDWLERMESGASEEDRWRSPGFLAGWLAAKIRVGEGTEGWQALNANWDVAEDRGWEVCLDGGEVDDCRRNRRATVTFPDRLRMFLEENGYSFDPG